MSRNRTCFGIIPAPKGLTLRKNNVVARKAFALNLPINLFDLLMLALLVAGVMRGRKHGLSREWLMLCKWLTLLVIGAALYGPLGELMAGSGTLDLLSAYILAYLAIGLVVFVGFALVERRLTPKMTGTDFFGRTEYYLGMGSGLVRFACMSLVAMALLNARGFSPAELKAMDKYQLDAYGSTIFPTLHSLQVAVFEGSFSGSLVHKDLGFLLISSTEPHQIEPAPKASQQSAKR